MLSNIIAPAFLGQTLENPNGDFVIAEWTDEGGVWDPPHYIAPLHVHRLDDEAWYVLEGTLNIRRGEEVVVAPAGSCVLVPRGTPHTYWNPGPEPARYLLIMTTRIHKLIEAIHASSDRSLPALKALFESHDAELLGG